MVVSAAVENLASCLSRICAGEGALLGGFLSELASSVVYVPYRKEGQGEALTSEPEPALATEVSGNLQIQTLTLKVATFRPLRWGRNKSALRMIPVFTDQALLCEWAGERYDSLELLGSELALALPSGTSLVVNPGQNQYLELSSEDVEMLREADPVKPRAPLYLAVDNSHTGGKQKATDLMPRDFLPVEGSAQDLSVEKVFAEVEGRLLARLAAVLERYPEIDEAYLTESDVEFANPVALGLRYRELSPGRRFALIEAIAELARSFYGYAGAIEVLENSELGASAWELFRAMKPIWSRKGIMALRSEG